MVEGNAVGEDFRATGFVGDLANPRHYTEPLRIDGVSCDVLKKQLRMMLLIRRVEERLGDEVAAGRVATPCHLGIGQEAIAVGISEHLRKTDRVFGTHRSHPHFIAMSGSVYSLFAEVLGRVDGCSRGMGGSMHLQGIDIGFIGSVPIVGGTLPLAVGAALAAKKDKSTDIAVAYFGDGASEEGVLHESLNLAAILKAPVLFVCENNLFSSHLHISLRQPGNRIGRFAESHAISTETVDGNDVVAVSDAASRLISAMRDGKGPAFLEAITYRWRGHVGPREDNDVGVNRGSDLLLWKGRDPVRRLFDALSACGAMDDAEFNILNGQVVHDVTSAWKRAETSSYPDGAALMDLVYSEKN